MFVRAGDAFAAIQKAPRPNYEFADLWALPGGMVHADRIETVTASFVTAFAVKRARVETGLPPVSAALAPLGPIVTGYLAKGRQCFTVVSAFVGTVDVRNTLRPGDDTIQEAKWLSLPPDFLEFAPANQLILAHLLWPELPLALQDRLRNQLKSALETCAAAAAEAGLAAVVPPWSNTEALSAWRNAWPET